MSKCQEGCTCARHSRDKDTYRSVGTKCQKGCTCLRHGGQPYDPDAPPKPRASAVGAGGGTGGTCPSGCTCKRHSRPKDTYRSGSTKCRPGCTCSRHSRVMTEEHKAKIAEANAARRGESHKCPEGCTCARHEGLGYRGGSKPGRQFSEQGRANIGRAAKKRERSDEELIQLAEQMKANHADPEWEATRIAALVEALTGTSCPEGCACEKHSEHARQAAAAAHLGTTHSDETKAKISEGSKAHWAKFTPEERSEIAWQRIKKYGQAKVSKAEYALAPYLAALGYQHNDDRALAVGRKFPDFYDEENNKLFEYFGNYWHSPEQEALLIRYYEMLGWECEVLWEVDVFEWMAKHKHLLTDEQYGGTWDIIKRKTGVGWVSPSS